MKLKSLKTKFILVFLSLALAITGFSFIVNSNFANADSNEPYFYSLLENDNAKNFYKAIEKMENDDYLLEGNKEFDLIENNFISETQIADYSKGNANILKDYGAGRDAYVMDHADNFYTDFSKLSISIGTQNGQYLATLGTGRTDSYYLDNNLNKDDITSKKLALSQKVATLIVDTTDKTDFEKVQIANKALIDNVTYSFCNEDEMQAYQPYIRTSYGALINGYAVCEGYARALKLLLDEMNVENQLVYGYLMSNEGAFESHMWNYVKIENKWYAVDSTINDTMKDEKYSFLQGEDDFSYEHIEEKVISEAGYSFSYPLLSKYSYGSETLPTVISYNQADDGKYLNVVLSYNNLSATELAKTGLYLSVSYSSQTSTQDNIVWNDYAAISEIIKLTENNYEETLETTTLKDWGSVPFVKFAVISKAPDGLFGKYSNIDSEDILCESDIIINDAYEGIVASPYAYKVSPSNTAKMDITKTYHITLTYDEQLVKVDENGDIEIEVASTHGATSEQYSIKNIEWDSINNQLSFDFTPSKMFLHNGEGYNFAPINLVGIESNKRPYAVSYSFQYTSIVCNKILDNGALYMDIYAHPRLIDSSDLSMQNWQLNGEQVGENQRSQLALVVTSPSESDNKDMTDSILENTNLEENDILSSSTYELDLDLCGFLTRVPNGTYMKVSFGFPQGYSAKDAGVTFKLYHFKRGSDGKIDPSQTVEIPCVITEYGLVAEINDFSPFAVVAVSKDKVENQTNKAIYSRVIGNGGTIKLESSSSNIAFVEQNGKATFNVTAEEGYQVDYIMLNQKEIDVVDGKIELEYEDLQDNNILEVAFVSSRVLEYEEENNITNIQKEFTSKYNTPLPPQQPTTNNMGLIALLIVGVIAVVVGIAMFIYFNNKRELSRRTSNNKPSQK